MTAIRKPQMDVTEEQAKVLIGKYILVGIAHCNAEGAVISREQIHGIVERANLNEGLVIKLHNSNKERGVPLQLSNLQVAHLGNYELSGTDEVVKDPDYTLRLSLNENGQCC